MLMTKHCQLVIRVVTLVDTAITTTHYKIILYSITRHVDFIRVIITLTDRQRLPLAVATRFSPSHNPGIHLNDRQLRRPLLLI